MLPWHLFSLTPRDLSGELIRSWNYTASVSAAIGSFCQTERIVPADRAAIITGVSATYNGADRPNSLEVTVNEPGTAPNSLILELFLSQQTGTNQYNAYGSTYFIAGPNTTINLAVPTNTLLGIQTAIFGFAGFLIPRGDATYL